MKASFSALFVLAAFVNACGSSPSPAPVAPPPAPVVETKAPPPPAPVAEPTPEEKKKAEELKQLEADRAALQTENAKELARFTPELRAQAKTLAEKTYPSARVALQAALAAKHRKPGNSERDKYRHPIETLEFFGFKPSQTVLEYGPGEGWYTELLAPSVAVKGKLLVTMPDPNGPRDNRNTLYGERLKSFLERSPELYGKVQTVVIDSKTPKLGLDKSVDLAVVIRGLHGMQNSRTLQAWLGEIHSALKPKGVLGIVQHRAKADANPEASSKQGYLPEKWVIEQIEAAGFKLQGKSEINANPKDTKDYPEGVWSLPPTYRLKDKDREKYAAIGESDRMTLKFVKVEKAVPPVPKATPAPSAAPAPSAMPAPKAVPAPSAAPAPKAVPSPKAAPAPKSAVPAPAPTPVPAPKP